MKILGDKLAPQLTQEDWALIAKIAPAPQ